MRRHGCPAGLPFFSQPPARESKYLLLLRKGRLAAPQSEQDWEDEQRWPAPCSQQALKRSPRIPSRPNESRPLSTKLVRRRWVTEVDVGQ